MQKHCQWNSVSSVRERMLWFVYVYSFGDLRTQFKRCKREDVLPRSYLQCSFTSRPLLLPQISDLLLLRRHLATCINVHAVSPFTRRLRISIVFFVRQPPASPTKKDCRRRGIRHVDKWDSSLSCWPSNISVSRRSVRQFRADVITLDKENIDDNLS